MITRAKIYPKKKKRTDRTLGQMVIISREEEEN